jgi:hypothetical protein
LWIALVRFPLSTSLECTNRWVYLLPFDPSAHLLSLRVLLPSCDSPNPSGGGGSGSAALQRIPDENHLRCHHPVCVSILDHCHHLPPRSLPPPAHTIFLSSPVPPLPLTTISNRIHPRQTPSPLDLYPSFSFGCHRASISG